jgi:F0F1-type ATP synthase alpha subunit
LDAATQYLLNRGARLTEVLKQPQFTPIPIEQQVVIIYAATKGYLDRLKISDILPFQQAVLQEISSDVLKEIAEKKEIVPELDKKLKGFFDGFTERFLASR